MCSLQRELICPGGEICIYVWQINSRSWRRRREAPTEVRQLNYQRQSRAAEVLQNQGPPRTMLALGLAGITCLSGTTAMSLWNEWHSHLQEQGPASAFSLKGSKTPGGKNVRSALLNGKAKQSDHRSLENSCFSHVRSAEPLPPGPSPFRSHDLGSFTSYLQEAIDGILVPRQVQKRRSQTNSSTLRGSEQ